MIPVTRKYSFALIRGYILASSLLILTVVTACFYSSSSQSLSSTQPMMVTTTDSLEGFHIKEYKGIVRGITVREPGPISNFKASLKSVVGGKINSYVTLCETARQQAIDEMVAHAQAAGANAVVGFRFDSSSFGESGDMVTEVVCYGTAVVIESGEKPLKAAVLN